MTGDQYIIKQITSWCLVLVFAIGTGCTATGDDQNYRLLDEEPHPHNIDPDPTPGSSVTPINAEALASDTYPADTTSSTAVSRKPEHLTVDATDQPIELIQPKLLAAEDEDLTGLDAELEELHRLAGSSTEQNLSTDDDALNVVTIHEPTMDRPSLRGLSRSHWQTIVTGPVRGGTSHNPIYFRDVQGGWEPQVDPDLPKLDMRLSSALDGAKSRNWNKWHAESLLIQPFKMLYDGIAIVLKQPSEPVFSKVRTPENHQSRRSNKTH